MNRWPDWIDAINNPPEDDDVYLILYDGVVGIGFYRHAVEYWSDNDGDFEQGSVTHYMPLPAPPPKTP